MNNPSFLRVSWLGFNVEPSPFLSTGCVICSVCSLLQLCSNPVAWLWYSCIHYVMPSARSTDAAWRGALHCFYNETLCRGCWMMNDVYVYRCVQSQAGGLKKSETFYEVQSTPPAGSRLSLVRPLQSVGSSWEWRYVKSSFVTTHTKFNETWSNPVTFTGLGNYEVNDGLWVSSLTTHRLVTTWELQAASVCCFTHGWKLKTLLLPTTQRVAYFLKAASCSYTIIIQPF